MALIVEPSMWLKILLTDRSRCQSEAQSCFLRGELISDCHDGYDLLAASSHSFLGFRFWINALVISAPNIVKIE